MSSSELSVITPPPFWTQSLGATQGAGYQRSSNITRKVGPNDDVMIEKDSGFHVLLDVIHYAPSEITAKLLPDNVIMIQGKHEENGNVERNFARKYNIPKQFSAKNAKIEVKGDGYLEIDATTKV